MDHDCPVMVGVSRKFGLHKAPNKRLKESTSMALKAVEKGIKILRVHDVAETRSVLVAAIVLIYMVVYGHGLPTSINKHLVF